jgi:hypothetical protein
LQNYLVLDQHIVTVSMMTNTTKTCPLCQEQHPDDAVRCPYGGVSISPLAPQMDEPTKARFEKSVLELFGAGWDSLKIAAWAGSAASGYGKFFTVDEAHEPILKICRAANQATRKAYTEAMRQVRQDVREMFPSIGKMIGGF